MSDIHTTLFETQAYVEGLRNLVAEAGGTFNYLTAFQFEQLLRPVSEALDKALAAVEQTQSPTRSKDLAGDETESFSKRAA